MSFNRWACTSYMIFCSFKECSLSFSNIGRFTSRTWKLVNKIWFTKLVQLILHICEKRYLFVINIFFLNIAYFTFLKFSILIANVTIHFILFRFYCHYHFILSFFSYSLGKINLSTLINVFNTKPINPIQKHPRIIES